MRFEDGDGVKLFESEEWGGIAVFKQISPCIRANKIGAAGVIEMNTKERIDEMCRQYGTTRSNMKRCDLAKGIKRAERKRRREKKEKEGTIFL